MLTDVPAANTRYIADCGFVLEYIPGTPIKLVHLNPTIRCQVEDLLERFEEEVRLGHVWDSSCFVPGTRADFAVIDFAGWDGFASYQLRLNDVGTLTANMRACLENEHVA